AAAAALAAGPPPLPTVGRRARARAPDGEELGRVLARPAGRPVEPPDADSAAFAGVTGRPPQLAVQRTRPFSQRLRIDQIDLEIRMESWLTSDTIRRMGFGHAIAAREHTLIVERGVSFAAFDAHGRAVRTAYASNIFAPQARYLVSIERKWQSGPTRDTRDARTDP